MAGCDRATMLLDKFRLEVSSYVKNPSLWQSNRSRIGDNRRLERMVVITSTGLLWPGSLATVTQIIRLTAARTVEELITSYLDIRRNFWYVNKFHLLLICFIDITIVYTCRKGLLILQINYLSLLIKKRRILTPKTNR